MKSNEQLLAALRAADRARDAHSDAVYVKGYESAADIVEDERLEKAYLAALEAYAARNRAEL
jgi:hypothetical protein